MLRRLGSNAARSLLSLALVAWAGAALPQEPVAQEPAGDSAAVAPSARTWDVSCTEAEEGRPPACRVSATAMLQPQNQRLLTVVLLRQPETGSLVLLFQVAHGAAIPAGIAWQVDEGEAQQLPFQRSDAEGLYVGIAVVDELLAVLRRGGALRVSFVDAARRETLAVSMPLAGFGAAVDEFFAAERRPSP